MNLSDIKVREQLPLFLNEAGLVDSGVEIGVAFGGFSEIILKTWKGRRLFCIDPWAPQPKEIYREDTGGHHFEAWFSEVPDRLLKQFAGRAVIWREFSAQAARYIADHSLDFVYIDGNHSFEAVSADIHAWEPKIKAGGLLCGHDYYNATENGYWCQVKDAVDKVAKENGLPLVTCADNWFIRLE